MTVTIDEAFSTGFTMTMWKCYCGLSGVPDEAIVTLTHTGYLPMRTPPVTPPTTLMLRGFRDLDSWYRCGC